MLDQKKRTSQANWTKHEQHYANYIKPAIGGRKLSCIAPIHWQAAIDAAAKKGRSRRTCANIRASITCFIKYARRARWEIQPLEDGDLIISKQAAPSKEKRVLQPDALRLLFTDPRIVRYGRKELAQYSYAWQFLAATGLRRGEMCGLKNEDINGNILSIKRSINNERQLTAGKNDNARRTIELSQVAMDVLQRQREMLAEKNIKSPWVFPDRFGERPTPNNVYDQWCTWRSQNGLELSLHELRHTFISINKADLPLELMKATVGHSSSMDTFATYGHEIEGERHRAAQIIDGVFARIIKDE